MLNVSKNIILNFTGVPDLVYLLAVYLSFDWSMVVIQF